MKKFTAILLAALMILAALAGCAKRAPDEEGTAPGSAAEPIVPGTPATKEQAAANNAGIQPGSVRLIQFSDLDDGDPIAVIETSEGVVKIRLFPDQTPKTSAAFEELIDAGFYNGQKFGTVVPGYKIECAGPEGGDAGFPEEPEFSLDLWNFRGAVALANNGADFMIVQAGRCLNPKEELEELNFPKTVIDRYIDEGGAPHQDWKNPVFGMVIEGMEIVDAIASAKIDENGNPETPVIISDTFMDYYEDENAESEAPEEDGEDAEEESAEESQAS